MKLAFPLCYNRGMKQRAFTLVELIIILLITGILAAVAIINAPDLPKMRTEQAAHKVKSDIRYVQNYALASRQRTRVDFSAAADNYTVYREPSAGNWEILANPLTGNDFIVSFASGEYAGVSISTVNFVSAGYNLVFDAAGIPYGYDPSGGAATALSSTGTVVLTGNTTKAVSVAPRTGNVSIQ